MAAHSNRSPSPLSSRPINPNPRNHESNSTIRRSFTGSKPSLLTNQRRLDPITPANSPSDFAGRRSVGKDWEEKENDEKDCVLKASKLQSPAKGCKSFMAPTISAASKFTPSPRKKVLVERNEPVRTSISFSDGKAMFFSNVSQDLEPRNENFTDSTLAGSENKKAVVVESHPVSKPCKKVTFSEIPSDSLHSTESVITDSDSLKVESKVVQSPIAPLDADPSLPPYDPKTNYLSPRPQFIRYKPNPRVEMLLNKEKALDSDELEYTLMAEMMSEGFSYSDEVSEDMVIGLDEEIEADSHVSEPPSLSLPVGTTAIDEISEEEFVGSDGKQKQWSMSRLMCFSMLLLLLLAACVSVSPSFDESFIKDLSLSNMSSSLCEQSRAVVASARLNLGRVARHANHVAASSAALVCKLANELVEGEKQAPLQFMNLSDLQENAWKEAYFLKRVENVEEDEYEEELDTEMEEEEEAYADEEELDLDAEIDAFEEEEAYAEADYDIYIEKGYGEVVATEETAPDSVVQTDMYQSAAAPLDEVSEVEAAAEVVMETSPDSAHLESVDQSAATPLDEVTEVEAAAEAVMETSPDSAHLESVDQSAAAPQNQKTEVVAAMKSQGAIDVGASVNAETITSDQRSSNTESTPGKGSAVAVAISCLIAGVVGVAAFFVYKRIPSSSSNVVQVEPIVSKQKDNGVTRSSNTKSTQQEKEYSKSWQTESEMSSSYQYQRSGGANEVESSERKTRKYSKRESLASSSESPSYGSFTTYERIPIKTNGYGDEEIMTPVRRSSRIRKQVTST